VGRGRDATGVDWGAVRPEAAPRGEYDAARQGAGLVRLEGRELLCATGPRRLEFLQGMLSNDVAGRAPGQGCRAALTNVKGGILALLRALVLPDQVVLEIDGSRREAVTRTLEHHRVAAPVRFAPQAGVVLGLVGPAAPEVLRGAGAASVPEMPEAHATAEIGGQTVRLVRAGDLPLGGYVVHAPPEAAASVEARLREAGASGIGRPTLDTLRVEALRPWYGTDVTEENLLHETGLLAEIHSPTKGCYLGQEVVARLEARGGHVNKALRGLRLTARATSGEAVLAEGREVGRVTTVGSSPLFGEIALAFVHRNHLAAGTAVTAGGGPATVVTSFEGATP
jgi:folate-binding protein YgfZ